MNRNIDPDEINVKNDLSRLAYEIYSRYEEKKASNYIGAILKKISQGGSYRDVYEFARKIGLGDIFKEVIDSWNYVIDMNDYKKVSTAFMDIVLKYSQDITDLTELVQKGINESLGLHIRPQKTDIDRKKIQELVDKIIMGIPLDSDEVSKLNGIDADFATYAAKLTDEIIRNNAELQRKSGFNIVLVRRYDDIGIHDYSRYSDGRKAKHGAEVCQYCKSLEGTYNYDDVSNGKSDVWKRHEGCTCSIDYVNKGRTTRVNNYKKDVVVKPRKERNYDNFNQILENKRKDLESIGYTNTKEWTPVIINSVWKNRKEKGYIN